MNVEEVVSTYVSMRDQIQAIEARAKEETAPYRQALSLIEDALHKHMLDLNVKSLPTNSGTPYLTEQTSVKITDWDSALAAVLTSGEFDAFERRITKTWLEEKIEKGIAVPGVEMISFLKVNVRRS